MSQINRITNYINRYPNYSFAILNISPGILVKRIVQGGKTKFKVADEKNLIPKDHLNLFNICKKKYPILLKPTFEPDNEMFFLFISPYHAHIIEDYKEDLLLISLNKAIIPEDDYFSRNSLKRAIFSDNLADLEEEINYIIFILDGTRVVTSEIFYCDKYKEYIDALKQATFGNFLSFIKEEEITNEKNLISCLAKNGVPSLVQDKYLEFWKDYDDFHDLIDEIHLEIRRKEIELDALIEVRNKDPRTALIRYFHYDFERAREFLEEVKEL